MDNKNNTILIFAVLSVLYGHQGELVSINLPLHTDKQIKHTITTH